MLKTLQWQKIPIDLTVSKFATLTPREYFFGGQWDILLEPPAFTKSASTN